MTLWLGSWGWYRAMRLIHLADVHLGMENFGSYDSKAGVHSRVLEYLEALDCVIDVSKASNPDLIIFAGDAFKSRTPNPTLVTHFAHKIQALADIAPVVMVVGNHDRQRAGSERRHSISLYTELAARHQIIVAEDVATYYMDCAWIVALPWLYDVTLDGIYDRLDKALDSIQDNGKPVILAAHCMAEGCVMDSGFVCDLGRTAKGLQDDNLVIPKSLLCDPDLWDYVALGHLHKHQVLCDRPPVVYSGSIERVTWGERDGPKGFIIADVDKGGASWKFVDVQVAPMIELSLGYKELGKLEDMDLEGAIVRLTIQLSGKTSTSKAYRGAAGILANTGCRIDVINVVTPQVERTRIQTWHVEGMTTMELLDAYFEDAGIDPKRKRILLDAAKGLIEEA